MTGRMRECIQSVSWYIKGGKFVSVVKHYRTLVLALLLTHVITKKSYGRDCASWGKRADCIQVSVRFVILISRRPMFLLIFFKIIDRIVIAHSDCSLQRFTNAAQRCIKAVYQPYGNFFCIFTAALLQLSVSLPQQSRKWTAAANRKQRSCNLSAALIAALF